MEATRTQVASFDAFGFTVVRGVLTVAESRALAVELEGAFESAYGAAALRPAPAWLPGLADATPRSASLLVDDGGLWALAEQLLRCEALPVPPEVAWLTGRTPWHCDDPLGLTGVKFLFYPGKPACGLRLLPMSHREGGGRVIEEVVASLPASSPADPARLMSLPGIGVDLRDGDGIAIDMHVWHCYAEAEPRILWGPEYVSLPSAMADDARREAKFASIAEAGLIEGRSVRWPVWCDWLRRADTSVRRTRAVHMLETAGAFGHGRGAI